MVSSPVTVQIEESINQNSLKKKKKRLFYFAKYCCQTKPGSDISHLISFELKVLEASLQLNCPLHKIGKKKKKRIEYKSCLLLYHHHSHLIQELPGVAFPTGHEITTALGTLL